MATAFGARVVDRLVGQACDMQVRNYIHPSSDGTALYLGDIVKLATSSVTLANGQILREVVKAGATDIPVGVVVGINPILGYTVGLENLNRLYLPASTQGVVMVCDDPFVIFEMLSSNGTPAATDASKKANIVYAAGSVYTGMSGSTIDVSSVNTTDTLQLQLQGFREAADTVIGAPVIYRANFAIHQFLPGTGTNDVGV